MRVAIAVVQRRPNQAEELTDILDEEVRLLEAPEVPALRHPGVVHQVVAALHERARLTLRSV